MISIKISREYLEKEFKFEKNFTKEDITSISNNIEDAVIFNEDNGLTLYIEGIERMIGEYRTDYICKFVKNNNNEYRVSETIYKEIITNPVLLNYKKPMVFLIIVCIIFGIYCFFNNQMF